MRMGAGNFFASRYKSVNWPNLYLNDDEPTLNANNDNANDKWGAPSCR